MVSKDGLIVGGKLVLLHKKNVSHAPVVGKKTKNVVTYNSVIPTKIPRHTALPRYLVGVAECKFSSFGGVRRGTPGGGQSVRCYSVFSNHPGLRPPPPMDWNLIHKTGAVATITNHYPLALTLAHNLPLDFYSICYIMHTL